MSLKVLSHGDLKTTSSTTKSSLLENGPTCKCLSVSNVNGLTQSQNGKLSPEESVFVKMSSSAASSGYGGLQRRGFRAVHMVRPSSATTQGGAVIQLSRLQGELVRKRKLKQKVFSSQQRAVVCSRMAEEATQARAEAERRQNESEIQAQLCREQEGEALLQNSSLKEEIKQLKKQLPDMQQLLTQAEKNYFESKVKLDRINTEKEVIVEENKALEQEKHDLKQRLKDVIQEVRLVKDTEMSQRRRAAAAEEALERATQLQYSAEREKRLTEHDRDEKRKECAIWIKKHDALAKILRSQEEEKSKRQDKASQAKFQNFFLCVAESDQRISILKNKDGTPRGFEEGESVSFTVPDSEIDQKGKSHDRIIYRTIAPGSGDGNACQTNELSAVEQHSSVSTKRGKKVVEYFWFPANDGEN
ncbi:caldesmon-like isoform X3 [Pleurodeles waltl]|uniref:caldesmon-like isoform X3 n=1 Tax=Pleurodeles waltl TaxID=8319 RepID=UPI003709844F